MVEFNWDDLDEEGLVKRMVLEHGSIITSWDWRYKEDGAIEWFISNMVWAPPSVIPITVKGYVSTSPYD